MQLNESDFRKQVRDAIDGSIQKNVTPDLSQVKSDVAQLISDVSSVRSEVSLLKNDIASIHSQLALLIKRFP